MKKILILLFCTLIVITLSGFSYESSQDSSEDKIIFNIDDLYDYQKKYKSTDIELCASNSTKSYMDYKAITARDSKQYWFIKDEMTVDEETGLLYDEEGFIGVALGSYFGTIGDRFYFTLSSGIILPLIKVDEKADIHTDSTNCYHKYDGSIIEFVVDTTIAMNYFGKLSNKYILNGNFDNYSLFKGEIIKMEKVSDDESEKYVTYGKEQEYIESTNIFEYASGY